MFIQLAMQFQYEFKIVISKIDPNSQFQNCDDVKIDI